MSVFIILSLIVINNVMIGELVVFFGKSDYCFGKGY